ncbi:MAG TPA: hypothetical protein VL443_11700 [Cyclobacteriaceae bacterium]|jgi:hypothetical protein|nr:hypothetical protein [Cyclobacteriaceae bacterium]
MKTLLTITFALVLFSCGKNATSDKNDLLTSLNWVVEKGSIDGETPKATEIYRFQTDGTYLLESGEVKVNGKWNWTSEGEIFLQTEGMTINGHVNKFDKSSNSYLKIVELTEKTLKTLERNDGDTWDSGFAKEKNYSAQRL